MNGWIRMFILCPILALLAACASNSAVSGTHTDPNVLSHEQIAHYSNALQAVKTMRGQWLRGRAPGDLDTAGGDVKVFRDGMEVGGVDELASMSTDGIAFIRFYNGIQASQRWGLGHQNGVIYVGSHSGMDPGGRP